MSFFSYNSWLIFRVSSWTQKKRFMATASFLFLLFLIWWLFSLRGLLKTYADLKATNQQSSLPNEELESMRGGNNAAHTHLDPLSFMTFIINNAAESSLSLESYTTVEGDALDTRQVSDVCLSGSFESFKKFIENNNKASVHLASCTLKSENGKKIFGTFVFKIS